MFSKVNGNVVEKKLFSLQMPIVLDSCRIIQICVCAAFEPFCILVCFVIINHVLRLIYTIKVSFHNIFLSDQMFHRGNCNRKVIHYSEQNGMIHLQLMQYTCIYTAHTFAVLYIYYHAVPPYYTILCCTVYFLVSCFFYILSMNGPIFTIFTLTSCTFCQDVRAYMYVLFGGCFYDKCLD